MLWRVFKLKFRFTHKVENVPWLVDKDCLIDHKHGYAPNPLCSIEFIVATKKPLDFKTIKIHALKALKTTAVKVIEEEQEDGSGGLMISYNYDFGTILTENLVDDLKKLMVISLEEYEPIRVQIWLDETRKYSVWDDGRLLQSEEDCCEDMNTDSCCSTEVHYTGPS